MRSDDAHLDTVEEATRQVDDERDDGARRPLHEAACGVGARASCLCRLSRRLFGWHGAQRGTEEGRGERGGDLYGQVEREWDDVGTHFE